MRQPCPCICKILLARSFAGNVFVQGVAVECTEEQFNEYLQEAQPVVEQIVQSVLQD
jgi:hypothetical protein